MAGKHIRTLRSKKLHPEHVRLINEAIRHNAKGKEKDVHITYRKENGEESERKVRPLAVRGKSLFLAHCHERNAIRSFRVERISMVKKAFWDGFEKRAISAELLARAAEKARTLGLAEVSNKVNPGNMSTALKRMRQVAKFERGIISKSLKSLSGTVEDLKSLPGEIKGLGKPK